VRQRNGIFDQRAKQPPAKKSVGAIERRGQRCVGMIEAAAQSNIKRHARNPMALNARPSSDRRPSIRAPGTKRQRWRSAQRGAVTSAFKNKLSPHRQALYDEADELCVPKIRFCNIAGEGRRERVVM